MVDKFIMVDMSDERTGKIAEVLSSKTAKNILSVISESEKELSVSDISSKLKIPLNTVDYNLKKLISTGLVEESKSFFWSVKGRKIKTFKAANKKIIISTKPRFGGIVASALVFGAIGFAASVFGNIFNISRDLYSNKEIVSNLDSGIVEKMAAGGANSASLAAPSVSDSGNFIATNSSSFLSLFHNAWVWVLVGIVFGVGVYFIYKKFKEMKGGKF
jgi:DNA-binding transcriptional ArsR family regulator